jgi:hypothetical protein
MTSIRPDDIAFTLREKGLLLHWKNLDPDPNAAFNADNLDMTELVLSREGIEAILEGRPNRGSFLQSEHILLR